MRASTPDIELPSDAEDGPECPAPVAQFQRSAWEEDPSDRPVPSRHLLPLTQPQPGEQYAFVVDLDRCSGCKACVSACHSLNGLEEGEMWRNVGLLVGEPLPALGPSAAYQQTVTTACHHCLDPACANGCPVLAYDKDPVTGIVRHLDDQCIGCQYCVLKCPYDVPKYSSSKGIVRKCDLCHTRLAAGEAPACVQACPHEAIRIEVVSQARARLEGLAPDARLLPGAFPSEYTQPTTRYVSKRPIPGQSRPADTAALRLESAHGPLVGMLLLTQLAAGLHLAMVAVLATDSAAPVAAMAWAGWAMLVAGLTVGFAHLGRPLKAWRAFLGWRRSWMSREILAFSGYAILAGCVALRPGHLGLNMAVALAGLVSVFSSAMIYIDTRRSSWAARFVAPEFFGGALLLGSGAAAWWSSVRAPDEFHFWVWTTLSLLGTQAIWAMAQGVWAWKRPRSMRHRMALTMARLLPWEVVTRVVATLSGAGFLVAADMTAGSHATLWAAFGFAGLIVTVFLDRWFFFVACPAPRMPGGVRP